MKKEIPVPAIVGIVVVVIAVLGFFIFRQVAPEPVSKVEPKETSNRMLQGRSQMGGAGSRPPEGNQNRMMQGQGQMQGQSQMQNRNQMGGGGYQPPQGQGQTAPPPGPQQ